MNTESIDSVLFLSGEDAAKHGPGAMVWEEDESTLFIIMPGQRHLDAISVTRDLTKQQDRVWLLTGTREKPTLHPSLHLVGHWHGYLTDGRFVSC